MASSLTRDGNGKTLTPVKAIIADRLWMVRSSIERLLTAADPKVVVIPVSTGADLHNALILHPDATIVLIDDSIIADGDEATFAHVRKLASAAAIGVLAAAADRDRILKAIYYGAVAFILRDEEQESIAAALRQLLDGQVAFPRHILEKPIETPVPAQWSPDLTPRENEVVGLIGRGQSVARIAADLRLSPHTVRVHVTRVMKKLDLHDRPALTHYAVIRHQTGV
jgi:DNA-binding NarL/FixJ family response regulator